MFEKKKHAKIQVPPGSLASRIREVRKMDDFDKPSVGGQPHISSALPQAFRYSVRQIDREERTRSNKGGGRTVFRVGVCIYGHHWYFVYKYRRHDRQVQVHMHNMAINMHKSVSKQSIMYAR